MSALNRTPRPSGLTGKWHEVGTHAIRIAGGVQVCGCGPANHVSGPQWAVVDGVEYREEAFIQA